MCVCACAAYIASEGHLAFTKRQENDGISNMFLSVRCFASSIAESFDLKSLKAFEFRTVTSDWLSLAVEKTSRNTGDGKLTIA